jgi:hypothetical protein
VTRGVCEVVDGALARITERRQVSRRHGAFHVDDGGSPAVLDDATLVSMNLWGFDPRMWAVLAEAMDRADTASEDDEVLLPELVGRLVEGGGPLSRFEVLSTTSRCLGVTHPDDLGLVRTELAQEVASGARPREVFPRTAP